MRNQLVAVSCLLLSSCAGTRDMATTLSQPADTAVQHLASEQQARALVASLATGKVKFKGNVTFQLGGTGNVANVAPKAKAPVAVGPHATAAETKPAGLPWQVYAGGAVLLLGAGVVLGAKLL